ncbi:MAG: aminotransferase class I/II-fold pyridoxal phosphate-dependent enzyme, partial [Geodermatophilaceae bacterium]|nr:aminotransferase class I/II-fold pyridoxal phosphate-dependent enzyme [Geodermatophilaceae bacterium]
MRPQDVSLPELSLRRSMKWRRYDPDVLPLHVAETDLPTAEPIRAVLAEMVERGDFGYPVPGDLPEVYADFATWRYGQRVDPADVHVVGDVSQGIYVALRLLLQPGDGVVICPPVYYPFFSTIPAAGCRAVQVPLRRDGGRYELDLSGLEAAFAGGARAFLLCSPHNPVGRLWSAADLTAVADLADRYDVLVVADEIHAPLTYDG